MPEVDHDAWDGFGDEWVEAQTPARLLIVVERALREAKLDEVPEEDSYDYEEKFVPAFSKVAISMALEDFYREMADTGLIEPEVIEDGSIGYKITELGESVYYSEFAES